MSFRISPAWWPVLTIASPVLVPMLLMRNRRFQKNRARASAENSDRIGQAKSLDLPEVEFIDLTVLVEWKTEEGFVGDSGVSYLLATDLGSMLFDVGFGPTSPSFGHNAVKLGFDMDQVEALTISHLHLDHMGGMPAQRAHQVTLPDDMMPSKPIPCFLPDHAQAAGFTPQVVEEPQLLRAGIASTGPLARSLFVLGFTEEQALLARVKSKGLAVFTGCGHPTIEVILGMVGQLSSEPLYAIAGGLHFPVSGGRGNHAGLQLQTFMGTGKPPWQRITDKDLSRTIEAINRAAPKKVYLSAHDTCDHALARMKQELKAETQVLKAGATYRF